MNVKQLLAAMWCLPLVLGAQSVILDVDVSRQGIAISPLHYGLFFEDINYAADGGLYAELIRNRSFEDADSTEYWNVVTQGASSASISLVGDKLLNSAQGKALKLVVSKATPKACAGVENTGFWGIHAVKNREYKLSFFAKSETAWRGQLYAALTDSTGTVTYCRVPIEAPLTKEWQKYTCTLTSTGNDPKARFSLMASEPGTIYLDVVSLFPPTFKGHENGCRPELAQLLEDAKPKFMRFPGGCFVESFSRETTFQWKKTVGPIEERPGHANNWGYRTSDGMGYHEFLQLSEDVGATPMYVVNVGVWHGGFQPHSDIGFYIQDALDAIEYANGDVSTKYGAMRIANGHKEPFHMRLIEIGNENYQASASANSDHYAERYIQFYNAIKKKYPEVEVIGNVEAWGTDSPSWRNSHPVDYLDEHYYRDPAWFVAQYSKYDNYSRTGPKIYVGEYAVTMNCGNGNLNAALGEAVYMCGMENNSDIVAMNSYAPIFRNDNKYQWFIDMIHYNSSQFYCTPSYYVQQLFSNNIGTHLVQCTAADNNLLKNNSSKVGLGSWNTAVDFKEASITTPEGTVLFTDNFSSPAGWIPVRGTWNAARGMYSQSAISTSCTSVSAFSTSQTEYIYRVKARKNSGSEGFLILFNYKDDENYCWWNIGGWFNVSHGVEVCRGGIRTTAAITPGKLETGRWYDIRIEMRGEEAKCYLDDQLVHTVSVPEMKALYTTASLDERTNELFVKLVNPSANATRADITLKGAGGIMKAEVTTLSADSGLAENSMSQPHNIVPVSRPVTFDGLYMDYPVPAYSVNILKLKLAGVKAATGNAAR